MPPQQTPSNPIPGTPNQYDFIVNSSHRRSNDWLTSASFKTRVVVVLGGFFVLLILIWIFLSFLSSASGGSVQNFTALAEEQTELARISESPSRIADSDAAKNLASTTRVTLLSDEASFLSYLNGLSALPGTDTLAKTRSRQTDTELSAARTNGTYDATYTDIATTQLNTYARNLKLAYNAAHNATERQLLSQAYANAQLLLALSQQAADSQ